jgi:GT2 family glycosyltransferase
VRPEVGVVGGKVVSPWGQILHAGYLLCLDRDPPLLDAHRGIPDTARGHFGRANLVQNLLAVGPDCLAFRREVFEALGALDAAAFPQALFEVDLCLRARERGLRVVFTPYATVVQPRSTPARRLGGTQERQQLRARWSARLPRDPYWHPALDRSSADYRLRV